MIKYMLYGITLLNAALSVELQCAEFKVANEIATTYPAEFIYERSYEPGRSVTTSYKIGRGEFMVPLAAAYKEGQPKIYDLIAIKIQDKTHKASIKINDVLRSMLKSGEASIAIEKNESKPRFVVALTEKAPKDYKLDRIQAVLGNVPVRLYGKKEAAAAASAGEATLDILPAAAGAGAQ